MTASTLSLRNLVRRFGDHVAVEDVSLEVAPGELVVLLGPSGCGKTTTLRLIAGFLAPDAGDIRLDGISILGLPPHKRDMGIVFQSYALFQHLSVARNVAFGLEMRHTGTAETDARVREMLRLVRLEDFAARVPRQLSGGQQQRVALARALAIHPRILLLDEPLSNLDAALRQDMAREIRVLQQSRGITTIMVTHDQTEAMALADRLVLMHDGRVQQIGPPEALYLTPSNPFVARFIGGSNILRGRLESGINFVIGKSATFDLAAAYAYGGAAALAVRPDSIRLGTPDQTNARATGVVELCSWLGVAVEHVVRISHDATILVRQSGSGARHAAGTPVSLHWSREDEILFDNADRPVHASETIQSVPVMTSARTPAQ